MEDLERKRLVREQKFPKLIGDARRFGRLVSLEGFKDGREIFRGKRMVKREGRGEGEGKMARKVEWYYHRKG